MKKFVSVCLCFCLLLTLMPLYAQAEVEPVPQANMEAHLALTMGDVNGDGKVTAQDALLALQLSVYKIGYISGGFGGTNGTNAPFEADLTEFGQINAKDALLILKISVDTWSADLRFLEPEEFTTQTYEMKEEVYFAPQRFRDAWTLKQSDLPTEVKNAFADFPFEEKTLLLFSDSVTLAGTPKAVQVALYKNRAFLRYKHEDGYEVGQYAVGVAVSKERGDEIDSVFTQLSGFAQVVQPTLYSVEYPVYGMPEIVYPYYEVLETEEDALRVVNFMHWYNLTNEAMERLLYYRAESGFFENNKMVVWFHYGFHGKEVSRYKVNHTELKDDIVLVYVEGTLDEGTAQEEKQTFRMRLLDLPKTTAQGQENFELVSATAPQTPQQGSTTSTDISFEQTEYENAELNFENGILRFLKGGAYINSYDTWLQYSGYIIGSSFDGSRYDASFFENNSLIVFGGKPKSSGPVKNTVTGVRVTGNAIKVDLLETEETGLSYTCDFYNNLCVVELNQNFNDVKTLCFAIEYRKERVDYQGNVLELVDHQYLECTYCYTDEGIWECV